MKQYFTELEAASAAGVSPDTIREFISLGVLRLQDGQGDTKFLVRDDLLAAFHTLKAEETLAEPTAARPPTEETTTSRLQNGPTKQAIPEQAILEQAILERADPEQHQLEQPQNGASLEETVHSIEATEPTTSTSQSVESQQASSPQREQAAPSTPINSDRIQQSSSAVEGEALIEHRSFELLDLNCSLREQIEMLKQERDWLRKRVEILEVRSERDQLLLLSETKTVQKLLPSPKKSFWAFALPWLNEK